MDLLFPGWGIYLSAPSTSFDYVKGTKWKRLYTFFFNKHAVFTLALSNPAMSLIKHDMSSCGVHASLCKFSIFFCFQNVVKFHVVLCVLLWPCKIFSFLCPKLDMDNDQMLRFQSCDVFLEKKSPLNICHMFDPGL